MDDVVGVAVRRGQALLDLGRHREAEAQFRTALAASPGDPVTHTLLAQALLRQQRYDEARDHSRAALAADPEHVPAHSALAASLGGLEQLPEALEVVRRALDLAPGFAGLHLQHAYVLMAQDRPAEALASAERARALDPEDSDTATARAAALHELRRFDEADAAVAEALRLDPQNAEAHRLKGLLALRRGGSGSAVSAHRTALHLDPTDRHAREGLSLALKSRNPLYLALLRFNLWLNSVPTGVRVAVALLPFLLTRFLKPFSGQAWATALVVVVIGLVVLSWTLEPLMNCVLLLGRDRHLLGRAARRATFTFLGFAAAAITAVVLATAGGPGQLVGLAFGLGLWAMATGSGHTVREDRRGLLNVGSAVAAVLGATAFAAILAGAPGATLAVGLVLLGGVVATWVTVLS
ncbi:tetratricopeptide repeat protein [Saccharothrix syringae]|nr:tetratricopeptide repeat protein [Saccharothrix syringae]